jgi:NCAIR mutase (PurE)-related protein
MSAELDIQLDLLRPERIGLHEAIYSSGKSDAHLAEILRQAASRSMPLLLTRLSPAQFDAVPEALRGSLDYDPSSRTAIFGAVPTPSAPARVAVVAAGTSDAAVASEIERTLRFHGEACVRIMDVGAAGLWRLMARLEEIRSFPVVVVVAGMEAALPTVLGGLIGSVLIAVPTSVGYGVGAGGAAAMNSVLTSCAQGLLAVNIDNGFGAACAALRVLHAMTPAR